MSIISKETWDKFTQEEKEKIRKEWETKNTAEDNAYIPWYLENLFGKENLQPHPFTYEDVARKLFVDKESVYINDVGYIYSRENTCKILSTNKNNCTSEKQAEKLLAINKLLNVAKFLNKGWKPDWGNIEEKKYCFFINSESNLCISFDLGYSSKLVYFRTEELAKQAIQILGEETVRLALTTEY